MTSNVTWNYNEGVSACPQGKDQRYRATMCPEKKEIRCIAGIYGMLQTYISLKVRCW